MANLWRSRPAKTPRAVIAGLLAADVAFAFQQTAVVPAIHSVEQSLGASREWSAWLITVYLIVATIATPAMGRPADLYGRRRLLLMVTTGQPQFAAFTLAYLIAAVLCLAGAGTVLLGRGAKAAGRPRGETERRAPQPPSTADGHRQPSAHGEWAATAQAESVRLKPNQ